MVAEDIEVLDSSFMDLPFVLPRKNGQQSKVQIFSSRKWRALNRLPELFVTILSHETIHMVLWKLDGPASEAFDEIGSVSVISKDWRGLAKCAPYYHGVIGLDHRTSNRPVGREWPRFRSRN